MKMRGRSYSPSSTRSYSKSYRSLSPGGCYGGRVRDPPTSLLVRNLLLDTRPEDLRGPFGKFGRLKDIYLPRDYYTGEPRGFGFVQYVYPEDAEEAKYQMDGQIILGRELTVVFAEENRKKPSEMRARQRLGSRRGSRGSYYSRSPHRGSYYSRSPHRGSYYSRSPHRGSYYSRSPRYGRSYSRSPDYYYGRRHYSRSISPRDGKYRGRSYSRSPYGSRRWSESPGRERSCSRSLSRSYGDY